MIGSMLLEGAGWLGAVILLVAYVLVSAGTVGGRSGLYQTLNAIASVLLGVNSAWHRAWPSALVNIIWVGIAVATLTVGVMARPAASRGELEHARALDRDGSAS